MMKLSRLLLLAAMITVVLFVQAVPLVAGDQDMSAQDKKMMEQMMKYGSPDKNHELLKKYVGDWNVEMSTWQDPTAKPQMSKGTAKNTLILDGRYLKSSFEGAMGDMKFMGLEVIGYDLFKKMYTTFWVDSMSTAFMVTAGTLDRTGNVLTETGLVPDPMTDGKTMQKVKNVTTFIRDGKFKFEMFMVMPDGKETKSMELAYTRR